jgi:hypothetical protein
LEVSLQGKLTKNLKNKRLLQMKQPFILAVRTGLEPATHGVTGRYSNQLNYRTKLKRTALKTIFQRRCKYKVSFHSCKQ